MNLLPKTSKEFSSKQYWDEFFHKRGGKSFEWYGEYVDLCDYFQKYIKFIDNILIAGCGNSTISADLYKVGYENITNVDISDVVIKQMKEKYSYASKMKWIKNDLLKLEFKDNSFSCVLDKGTLDALMSDNSDETLEKAKKYFEELSRILKMSGRYICISLLQEHILKMLLQFFSANGWMMRFCRCFEAENSHDGGQFSFPVFIIICTKFKIIPGMTPIIEIINGSELKRVDTKDVEEFVKNAHEFALLKFNLKKKLIVDEEMSLELHDTKSDNIRYELFIVDVPKSTNKLPFAVFIVPHGRETEWLFNCRDGHLQLVESCGSRRLVVVHLMRNQNYGAMIDVQNELSTKVLELAPKKMPKNFQIPFLSAGEELGDRKEIYAGQSEYSGSFIVEDVKNSDNTYCRRLVFLNNRNIIQSEAKLMKSSKKSQNRSRIDHSYLGCTHHSVMLTSLQLTSYKASVLVIGLGGGALASFMHKYFPEAAITTVDIDNEIVTVAKKYFDFKVDSKLNNFVQDGVQFVCDQAKQGSKFDVVIFDVDSKDRNIGLSCPPKQFLESSFLSQVRSIVADKGIFVLNLACRDSNLIDSLIVEIKQVFSHIFCVKIPEEINRVLFCSNLNMLTHEQYLENELIRMNKYLKSKIKGSDVLNVRDILGNFSVL